MVSSSLANEALVLDTEKLALQYISKSKTEQLRRKWINKNFGFFKFCMKIRDLEIFSRTVFVHIRARYRCLKLVMNTGTSSESEVTCNVGWRGIFTYLWTTWKWSHLSGSCPPTKHFLDWIIQVIALSFQHTFHVQKYLKWILNTMPFCRIELELL